MKLKITTCAVALLVTTACHTLDTPVKTSQNETDIESCIRTVMKLDEGRWAYMGTIARLNGTFRTYQTISVHSAAGSDTWANKSFGGDVAGTEETAEAGRVKLVGSRVIPIENGVLRETEAVHYLSCKGPDAEGRYETNREYKLRNKDGTFDTAKNIAWYSEHGSYYTEDIYNEEGRVVARRSGVNTPAQK